MLELNSPDWAAYSHAYGDASNVPLLFEKLRTSTQNEWDSANAELTNTIMHQGDVYTATYAITPHLIQYATELGPGKQSDDLIFSIAYASRGGPGPEVPEELEEAWENAQDDARELILERLLQAQTSKEYTGCLIAGLLYLSGEWSFGSLVNEWFWESSLIARCPSCGNKEEVFWHKGTPTRVTLLDKFEKITIRPAADDIIDLDENFEFDEDEMPHQITSLAAASGHSEVEAQIRLLFGNLACNKCNSQIQLSLDNE